jgi:hypothetical protein
MVTSITDLIDLLASCQAHMSPADDDTIGSTNGRERDDGGFGCRIVRQESMDDTIKKTISEDNLTLDTKATGSTSSSSGSQNTYDSGSFQPQRVQRIEDDTDSYDQSTVTSRSHLDSHRLRGKDVFLEQVHSDDLTTLGSNASRSFHSQSPARIRYARNPHHRKVESMDSVLDTLTEEEDDSDEEATNRRAIDLESTSFSTPISSSVDRDQRHIGILSKQVPRSDNPNPVLYDPPPLSKGFAAHLGQWNVPPQNATKKDFATQGTGYQMHQTGNNNASANSPSLLSSQPPTDPFGFPTMNHDEHEWAVHQGANFLDSTSSNKSKQGALMSVKNGMEGTSTAPNRIPPARGKKSTLRGRRSPMRIGGGGVQSRRTPSRSLQNECASKENALPTPSTNKERPLAEKKPATPVQIAANIPQGLQVKNSTESSRTIDALERFKERRERIIGETATNVQVKATALSKSPQTRDSSKLVDAMGKTTRSQKKIAAVDESSQTLITSNQQGQQHTKATIARQRRDMRNPSHQDVSAKGSDISSPSSVVEQIRDENEKEVQRRRKTSRGSYNSREKRITKDTTSTGRQHDCREETPKREKSKALPHRKSEEEGSAPPFRRMRKPIMTPLRSLAIGKNTELYEEVLCGDLD